MPAKKPASLINRHETEAERQAREQREAALRPGRGLPAQAPTQLDNRKTGQAAWRYLMRRWGEAEGEIVTSLDLHLVINFCMAVDQLSQLNVMRDAAYDAWLIIAGDQQKAVEEERADDAVLLAIKVVGAFDAVLKLDSRIDRKMDLLHKLGQSLYLTPRARTGVAPKKKDPDEPKDELEELLDDVTEYVNRDGKA